MGVAVLNTVPESLCGFVLSQVPGSWSQAQPKVVIKQERDTIKNGPERLQQENRLVKSHLAVFGKVGFTALGRGEPGKHGRRRDGIYSLVAR